VAPSGERLSERSGGRLVVGEAAGHHFGRKDEAGYPAAYFLGMLAEHGGLETARRLLAATTILDGFTALWERKRLDLTVEALVLRPEFQGLSTDRNSRSRDVVWSSSATSPDNPGFQRTPSLRSSLPGAPGTQAGIRRSGPCRMPPCRRSQE
jgi:hypothetical protein